MNLNDLQVTWDAQKDRAMYTIDQEALHRIVRDQSGKIGMSINFFEISMILIVLTVCVVTASEPIVYGHDYHQFIVAAIWLMIAAYLIRGRVLRKRKDRFFDPTLLGDLNKAIAQIDYQIGRLRAFMWWFIVPAGIGGTVSFLVLYRHKPIWIWPMVALSMFLAWWCMRRDLDRKQLPKKRELEALRDKLTAESDEPPLDPL